MRRVVLALALAVVAAARRRLTAGPARAADECKGLRVCLPVDRPLGRRAGAAASTTSSPARSPGTSSRGTDARVATRDVDVSFRGEIGQPRRPRRDDAPQRRLPRARERARAPGPTSFQPFIGCIPTSGGGGRALTGVTAGERASSRRGRYPERRRHAPVRRRSQVVRVACPARSRLVGSTHAVAFSQTVPPSAAQRGAVRVTAHASPTASSSRASTPRPRQAPGPRCRCGPCLREDRDDLRLAAPPRVARRAAAGSRRLPLARAPAAARGDRIPEPRGARLGLGPFELEAPPRRRAAARRAVALLCVAVARPRMPLSATADRATVVLVVDVSVSMNAKDVAPTRLEAARAAITLVRRPRARPGQGRPRRVRGRPCRRHGADDRPQAPEAGIASLTPGFGTAIGDAVARGVELVRSSTGETGPVARRRRRTPGRSAPGQSSCSPTARRRAACCTPDDGARSRSRPAFPSTRSRSARSPAR